MAQAENVQQSVIRHAQNDMASIGPASAEASAGRPDAAATPEAGGKIGEHALGAMVRMGFKELAQVLPAFPDSVKPVEELGAPGNLPPMPNASHRAQFQSQDDDRAR